MVKSNTGKILMRIVSVIVFLILFLGIYAYADRVLERKDAYIKHAPFFEEKNDFDVLFLGTSHIRDGVYPMELWNGYGISSYNLGGPGNSLGVSYWNLVNALDYTTPKLVVIDCPQISYSEMLAENSNFTHTTFDEFPLSVNKVKAICDLAEEGNRMAYLWPFSVYHSRWNELTKSDFTANPSLDKGARFRISAAMPIESEQISPDEKSSMDTVGVDYLCKMIELCQERDIEVLLTYLPFPATESKLREANLVYDIAGLYGVRYINFFEGELLVDFDTDMADSDSHLNASGARKITEYLGEYMQENYGLTDRREDSAYNSWHEDYEAYAANKLELLRGQNSLDSELVLLQDSSFCSKICIKEGSAVLQDERMMKLIENASAEVEMISDIQDVQIETKSTLNGEVVNTSTYTVGDLDEYGNITAYKTD